MRHDTTIRLAASTGLALAALLALPGPGGAQQAASGWAPFLGCWTADGTPAGERVCIEETDDPATTRWVTTFADGESSTETVTVDGVFRPLEEEGVCTGESAARFSDAAERIYLEGRLVCDGRAEASSGLIAFTGPGIWTDIRAVGGEEGVAWSQRYVRADEGDSRTASRFERAAVRRTAFAGPSTADIVEVDGNVSASVAAAWLAEAGLDERVTADQLVAMDDAGVSTAVIDMAVALSNPDRFVFGAPNASDVPATTRGSRGYATGSMDPYDCDVRLLRLRNRGWHDRFYGRASLGRCGGYGYGLAHGYGSGYGYGAYPGWGYGYGYWGRPIPVTVTPSNQGGRVIDGRGYSQRGTAASDRPTRGSQPAVRTPPSSGGSSRGAVRRDGGGDSGGSSSSSGGRSATRRGGGGGLH